MHRRFLYLLTFLAGFTSLGMELAASRLLAPWFGNSILVWASLIATILLYLSLGYWYGGRLADRRPEEHLLLSLIGAAALLTGLIPILAQPVLRLTANIFQIFDAVVLIGVYGTVLLLFALPVTLLGMVTPFVIRLLTAGGKEVGQAAGSVYAISTLGSILGVFVPVLLLIPNVGTRRTFLLMALTLLACSIAGLWRADRKRALLFGIIWMALALVLLQSPHDQDPRILFEKESRYNYIRVIQQGPDIVLKLNEGAGDHSIYRPGMRLSNGIWDAFLIAPFFSPGVQPNDVQSMLIIGLAGGTIAHVATAAYGPIPIDGVEIDPAIIEVGQRYFAMTQPNLRPIAQDGRFFLRHGAGLYDIIAVDAYRPPYIPFHLTTVEFFKEAASHLTPHGVVAINVARTMEDDTLIIALANTMRQVFATVFVIDQPHLQGNLGNSLLIGVQTQATRQDFEANIHALSPGILAEIAHHYEEGVSLAPIGQGPILTDDKAPIEQMVHSMILRFFMASR